jgi:hypothetical protein
VAKLATACRLGQTALTRGVRVRVGYRVGQHGQLRQRHVAILGLLGAVRPTLRLTPSRGNRKHAMRAYPDLLACGITAMRFSFHVSGALKEIDSFWAARGLDRSRERLLFAGYSRGGQPHTVYLRWERSHEGCSDVYLGLDARPPSQVWPNRSTKAYRLRIMDLRDFIKKIRAMEVPYGVRARYTYPMVKDVEPILRLPHTRPTSISFDLLDEKQRSVMNVTYKRRYGRWVAIVEPLRGFPFPEGDNFFQLPYEMGCSLGKSIRKEPLP